MASDNFATTRFIFLLKKNAARLSSLIHPLQNHSSQAPTSTTSNSWPPLRLIRSLYNSLDLYSISWYETRYPLTSHRNHRCISTTSKPHVCPPQISTWHPPFPHPWAPFISHIPPSAKNLLYTHSRGSHSSPTRSPIPSRWLCHRSPSQATSRSSHKAHHYNQRQRL